MSPILPLTVAVALSSAAFGQTVGAAPTGLPHLPSMAYRLVAVSNMLGEANYFVRQLDLPSPWPLQGGDLKRIFVTPPKMGRGGSIETDNFSFYFNSQGKLWQLSRMENGENYVSVQKFDAWAKIPLSLNTNMAYQLATQWLNAIAVDIIALEKMHRPSVHQWFRWGEGVDPMKAWEKPDTITNKVMLPLCDVSWGTGNTPPIKVIVFGPTKELLALELNDTSFSRRPAIVINNWEELQRIPDPPKKQLQVVTPTAEPKTNVDGNIRTTLPAPFKRRIEEPKR